MKITLSQIPDSTPRPRRRAHLLAAMLLAAAVALATPAAHAADDDGLPPTPPATPDTPATEDTPLHTIAMYLPNRILDVFDFVRARVRLGPGAAVGVRATEAVDLYLGTYSSIYVGLPGPRQREMVKWPAGYESLTGAEFVTADATTGARSDGGPAFGPDYSATEFGAGVQALIVGADIGIDPYEILDFVAGFFLIDLRHDDF